MAFPLLSLKLWLDPIPRSGPENMAADEWLLETVREPVLRVYDWQEGWGSLGRFCRLNQALESVKNVCWVRRSTGGGIVDHQQDWTYSLVIPETENLARIPAAESYRLIHESLALVLSDRFKLVDSAGNLAELGGVCFERPVASDVVDAVGNKIAGAGQRRTKWGLLHQGSVAGVCVGDASSERSKRLSGVLAMDWVGVEFVVPPEVIETKVRERYGNPAWTERR